MQTAKNRIIAASSRDFKVNKLLFVITNLVLFINFIMQMSMRKFITYYSESVTNSYTGYGLAQAGSVAIALCAVFTVFTLFHELYSKPHADLAYSLPAANLEKTVESIRGFTLDCLDGAVEKGILYGTGVWDEGEVQSSAHMKTAYEMGLHS